MRKVQYGRFVDFMPPSYDPDGLIGSQIYVRHAENESLKTAGYEYYITVGEKKITIDDATLLEKVKARFLFLFARKKKRILGERSKSTSNPYNDSSPQLGVKLNGDGKKTIDDSYYQSSEERVTKNQKKSREEKKEELKKIKETLEETKQMLEEQQVSETSKTQKR